MTKIRSKSQSTSGRGLSAGLSASAGMKADVKRTLKKTTAKPAERKPAAKAAVKASREQAVAKGEAAKARGASAQGRPPAGFEVRPSSGLQNLHASAGAAASLEADRAANPNVIGVGLDPATSDQVRDTVTRVGRTLQRAGESVRDGVVEVARRIKAGDDAMTAPQPPNPDVVEGHRTSLEKLGPGDSLEFGGGGTLTANGASASNRMGRSVKVNDDGTVSVKINGGASFGGSAKVTKVGGANAEVSGDGQVEYQFKNKEEAARGLEIIDRQLAWAAKADVAGSRRRPNSEAETEFMNKNVKSVDVSVSVGGGGGINLSTGGDKGNPGTFDVGINGKVTEKETIRLNYENGKPVSVTHGRTLTGNGGLSSKVGLGKGEGDGAQGGGLNGPSGAGEVSIASETTYKLPADVSVQDLQRDPLGTLQKSVPLEEESTKVTVTTKSTAASPTGATETETTYEAQGKWDDLKGSGILGESVFGDQQKAETRGKTSNVAVSKPKTIKYETSGLDLDIGIQVGPYGGGLKIKKQVRDAHGNGAAPAPSAP